MFVWVWAVWLVRRVSVVYVTHIKHTYYLELIDPFRGIYQLQVVCVFVFLTDLCIHIIIYRYI